MAADASCGFCDLPGWTSPQQVLYSWKSLGFAPIPVLPFGEVWGFAPIPVLPVLPSGEVWGFSPIPALPVARWGCCAHLHLLWGMSVQTLSWGQPDVVCNMTKD